jgi:hypothetical protein
MKVLDWQRLIATCLNVRNRRRQETKLGTTMTNEVPTANLNLTQKEADLVVAGIKMLWNARRYARIDENGDPYQVHHDVVALLAKLKGFSESAFSRS